MKKISFLPVLAILFSASSLRAQITKGALYLGGNIAVGSQKVSTDNAPTPNKQNSFTLSPVLGKVIRENLVLGIDASISFYKQEQYGATSKQKQDAYSGGIFIRHYKPVGKNFYLFLQERLGYRYEKYESSYPYGIPNDYKRNTISLNIVPGISYALNKKLHLETGFNNLFYLNYAHEKGNNYANNSSGPYKSDNFTAGTDLNGFSSLYVGFRIILGK